MDAKFLIGAIIGGTSIVFSLLCFSVMPVFTPGIVLAAAVGAAASIVALALQARRTALVALVFALTPLFGFLLLEYDPRRFDTGYLAFIAVGVALVVAVLAFADYSREKHANPATAVADRGPNGHH